jgi:AmiR/NasT family two-component response regulator
VLRSRARIGEYSANPDEAHFETVSEPQHVLQVLIANERDARLAMVARIVEALGHEIVATSTEVAEVGPLSRSTYADIALVGLGLDSTHALELISSIVGEASCPVIAVLDAADPGYVDEAAKRGVFAYVVLPGEPGELQNALDITLRRFAEFRNLQGAFGRRALIEQAKGILMARNSIDADSAYELLKAQSQRSGRKLFEVAEAMTQTHQLLSSQPRPE